MPGSHGAECPCNHEPEFLGSTYLTPYSIKNTEIYNVDQSKEELEAFSKKTYEERCNDEPSISSCMDSEILIRYDLMSPSRINSFLLIGGDEGSHPKICKVYCGHDNLTFEDLENVEPVKEVQLVSDFHGVVEYPLPAQKLLNTTILYLYLSERIDGNEDEEIKVHWIGIRGEASNYQRKAVVTVYEAKPNVKDHEVREKNTNNYII